MHGSTRCWLYSIAILAIPALANAAGLPPGAQDETSLDFALQFSNTRTTFDYVGGKSVETTLKHIGIAFYERGASRFELGLFGGHVFLGQTGNPATAGLEPDGSYAGIGVRAVLFQTSGFQGFCHASYTYQRVEHEENGQSVTLTWDEPRVQLGLVFAITNRWRVYGGTLWGSLDGQERVSGASPSTTDFERRRNTGGFVGIDFAVDPDGYIGIAAHSGMERSAEIYFKKRY